MRSGRRGQPPAAPPLDLTPEAATELRQRMLDHTYADWAEEPVPVLEGMTPRQALASDRGRRDVIDLLRSYELGEARSAEHEGREPASFQFLWNALGIERSRPAK